MKRYRPRFSLDGTERSMRHAVRQFSADSALKYINNESVNLLFDKKQNDFPCVRILSFNYYQYNRLKQTQKAYCSGWALHDLAYRIILYSNDYIGSTLRDDKELAVLLCETSAYYQTNEERFLAQLRQKYPDSTNFFFYLWGFGGEQFRYQKMNECFDNISRDLFILFKCQPVDQPEVDIASIVKDVMKTEWQNVVSSLLIAWFKAINDPCILEVQDFISWDESFSYDDYVAVINHYSLNYKDIREDNLQLGRQLLYTKPYIWTQKGQLISVSVFLDLFLYEHCILWIVRDYFLDKKEQHFPSLFGQFFEQYVQKLFSYYLPNDAYLHIKENDNKSADWKLQIGDYTFLIEQKSSILQLLAKQQETNIQTIKKFCKRTIIEALTQLDQTEKDLDNGQCIKIVLLYEDYLKAELLDEVFKLEECTVANDKNYWLMTITELEKFLDYYSIDPNGCLDLIENKINLEISDSRDGRSIDKLLADRGIVDNNYLTIDEIAFFRDIAQKNIEAHAFTNPLPNMELDKMILQ